MENEISKAAAALGRKGGSVKSESKKISSRENGKLGGRPSKYDKAHRRMEDMEFNDKQMDFIFEDWPNMDEHLDWLMTATKEEIEDWIDSAK